MLTLPKLIEEVYNFYRRRGECPILSDVSARLGESTGDAICRYIANLFSSSSVLHPPEPIDGNLYLQELSKLIEKNKVFSDVLYEGYDCHGRSVIRLREDLSFVDRAVIINYLREKGFIDKFGS